MYHQIVNSKAVFEKLLNKIQLAIHDNVKATLANSVNLIAKLRVKISTLDKSDWIKTLTILNKIIL